MLNYLTKKFVRFNSHNVCNLNNDYIVREIILNFNKKKN